MENVYTSIVVENQTATTTKTKLDFKFLSHRVCAHASGTGPYSPLFLPAELPCDLIFQRKKVKH